MSLWELKGVTEKRIESFFQSDVNEAKKKVKIIFDSIDDLIIFVNMSGRIIDVNKKITNLLGFNKLFFINKSIDELEEIFSRKDIGKISRNLKSISKHKTLKMRQIAIKSKSGRGIIVDISFVAIKREGKSIGVLMIMKDITQRVLAEEKLKELKEDYEMLFNTSNDMIFFTDLKGNVLRFNKQAMKLFRGRSRTKLSSFFDDGALEKIMKNISQIRKKAITEEIRLKDNRNREMICEVTFISVKKEKKEVGVQIIVRDITKRKKLEEIEMKAKEEKRIENIRTVFLMRISDELRQPLVPLLGYSSMLLEECKTPSQKEYLTKIIASTKKLRDLINKLITISHFESGAPELKITKTDMNKLIDSIIKEYAKEAKRKGLKIIKDFKLDQKLMIDKDRMREAITNIIDNAIRYTKKGEIKVSTSLDKKMALIEIVDSGAGIKKGATNTDMYLFDEEGRSGLQKKLKLGIPISKMIIEAHKGSIKIIGNKGKGTRVEIRLPISM